MSDSYKIAVEKEILKLEGSGWVDFPTSAGGLHVSSRIPESEISFPAESYDPSSNNHESSGVWASFRSKVISNTLLSLEIDLLWEVGSGNGNVALPLRKSGITVICVEPLHGGAIMTSSDGLRTYQGTLESLGLPSSSIKAVGVFDVLEHLERPETLLSEIHRVLEPGGYLLTTVPAHQWLFSDFDSSIGHFRRYSKNQLLKILINSGFVDSKVRFMFASFVLPAWTVRKLPTLLGRQRKSISTINAIKTQNEILRIFAPLIKILLSIEYRLRLPFGLSLFSVSKKP